MEPYDRLVAELIDTGATPGQMFGKPTLKVGTKAIACHFKDGVAFKLGAGTAEHTNALDLDGAKLFDPSGMGRAMKDWVWVPVAYADQWLQFGEAARQRLG
jgi:hypothetical protein